MALTIQMDMYGFIPIKTAATVETQVVDLLVVPQAADLQLHQHRHRIRVRQPRKQRQRLPQTVKEIR